MVDRLKNWHFFFQDLTLEAEGGLVRDTLRYIDFVPMIHTRKEGVLFSGSSYSPEFYDPVSEQKLIRS